MSVQSIGGFSLGDRVLLGAMEVEGVVTHLWNDGRAYVRDDRGEHIACGVNALVYADPERRNEAS